MSERVVGYVLDKYKALSQTFISGEIEELERTGVRVEVLAVVRGPIEPGPRVLSLRPMVGSRAGFLRHHLYWLLRNPVRYQRFRSTVKRLASETAVGEDFVPWKRIPHAATQFRKAGVRRLHAHFAWNGAAAAMCMSALTGWQWSVTLHANDIFSRQRNLMAKLDDADELVTVCDYNLQWMREHLGLTREVTMVVCGVELPELPARKPRAEWDVVTVGRLVEKKGFDVLIAAAAQMSKPRVAIVGDGKLDEQLRADVAARGLSDVVHFLGALDHDATLDVISRAKVFCLPARIAKNGDRDSMPVVLKEAMAREIPVVGTDVVAIPEMVDAEVGRLVPPDDPQALAAALTELLAMTPAQRARLGKAGRRRVAERFTMAGEVAKLSARLLGGR